MQRVYSKGQANSQCRHWVSKNLPQARIIDVVSTAAAAEHASREDFAAAIASRAAGDAYGLKVLAANIEDQPHNVTRFAVIAEHVPRHADRTRQDDVDAPPARTRPAQLAKAIAPLREEQQSLNMTWIESFPITTETAGTNPNYLFFVDIEGHADDDAVQRSIELVRKRCERLEILGSYPCGACVESRAVGG